MQSLEIIFWCSVALVAYTCVIYPLLMALIARLRPDQHRCGDFDGSVSIVLAVHNEEAGIVGRLEELTTLLAASGREGEILVVSDCSTDATVELARRFTERGVRVLELSTNVGKAAAMSRACAAATCDILVFGDVRQRWANNALDKLLRNFADARVGAASGELVVESRPGVMAGVGLYWRFEKWLRQNEAQVHSTVGVTGAICAVRRALFRPIPAGLVLDDVYWPLRVALQGYRVIHDRAAIAFDRLPDNPRDEFRRKVRTLSGNFQLLVRIPQALLPGFCPIWFQFLSHKILRLAVPWALLLMLASCAVLDGPLYRVLLVCQLLGYGLGIFGLWSAVGARVRLSAAAASFLVLNTAAWLSFWIWITGQSSKSWRKVRYTGISEPAMLGPREPVVVPSEAGFSAGTAEKPMTVLPRSGGV
jgi:cellulose synthase/poly-beta-1,6-N-acetylglucosamine synthase-like glycosyltransferase